MTTPLPPVALFVTQTHALQRATLIGILEQLVAKNIDTEQVSQWALRCFHALVQRDGDDDDDDDVDDVDDDDMDGDSQPVHSDEVIALVLDELMFADQGAFAPDSSQLQRLIAQLQS